MSTGRPVVLGISAFYHDSAAALVAGGEVVAAAQEERFSRRKHDAAFPARSIAFCLHQAGLRSIEEVDQVVFYEKPLVKFERLLESSLAMAPRGARQFLKSMPLWAGEKLWMRRELRRDLGGYAGPLLFTEHHEAHAAAAFLPSPFDRAAILTVDGVGEWATASMGVGRFNRVEILKEQHFPHSLGLLYSAFTQFTGFKVNSDEYKLMGLAPYGEPRHVELILDRLVEAKPDGSIRLDLSYFEFAEGLRMTSPRFAELFSAEPRVPESPIRPLDMDLAASIQAVTTRLMLDMARFAHRETGEEDLVLAGGVALNCVANGEILRRGPFRRIWIQPAATDSGSALGAALLVHHQVLGNPRPASPGRDRQHASLLGPAWSDAEIGEFLRRSGIHAEPSPDQDTLCQRVVDRLLDGKVVGWFQGRMEFGPRALGARSILADPRRSDMQSRLNLKIKFRESFRPFAPAVLAERAAEWFELEGESPYMLLVAPVHEKRRVAAPGEVLGLDKLKQVRSQIPAVTHVDHSARIQTVSREDQPLFHRLLSAFDQRSGCPVLVNTSFNVRGEPIVCAPAEAWRCFLRTGMDVLVLGPYVIDKDGLVLPELQLDDPGGAAEFAASDPGAEAAARAEETRTARRMGTGIAVGSTLFAALALHRGHTGRAAVLLAMALTAGAGAALELGAWRSLARILVRLTTGLGRLLSRILFLAVYYLIFTPVGMLSRACGWKGLRAADADSWWIARPTPEPSGGSERSVYERQW